MGEEKNSSVSPQKIHNQTARKRFVQKCVLPLNEDSPLMYQPQKMDFTMHSGKRTFMTILHNLNTIMFTLVEHVYKILSQNPLFKLLFCRTEIGYTVISR